MDFTADFKSFQEKVTSTLLSTTRVAGQIASEDLSFHRSSRPAVSSSLDAQNARLLALTNKLLKAATAGSDVRAPKLQDEEAVEDQWRNVVDVVDDLLEKADASLDEFTGVIKRLSPARQEKSDEAPLSHRRSSKKLPPTHSIANLPKPQRLFEKPHSNHDQPPFKPLLQSKPHALTSLEQLFASDTLPDDRPGYSHPYQAEIEQYTFPAQMYVKVPPRDYLPFDQTTATFVDTEEGVTSMLEDLKKAKEIAVDLEHHDLHSYIGLVCLMQISTRGKDWVVDTLKPWRENLQILNEVFADPSILKVFHGSSMDMIWLQRDLGLYVVGLFDTYHAAVALNLPRKGLQYLLQHFAGIEVSKKYQLADWRMRPIPPEMFDYARSDTHYLLNVFDKIRNQLIDYSGPDQNLIDYVLQESKKEALQRYERPVYDAEHGLGPGGWYNPLERTSATLNNEQFAVYRVVHQWRDKTARFEDEGPPFIMNQQSLFNIAQAMPSTTSALFNAVTTVSKFIKDRAEELLEVIHQARETGKLGPAVRDVIRERANEAQKHFPRGRFQRQINVLKDVIESNAVPLDVSGVECNVTRSLVSEFWGETLDKSFVQLSLPWSRTAAQEALRMVLPLPQHFQTTFDPVEVSKLTSAAPEQGTAATSETDSPKPNDIFIAKELGKPPKRKADVLDLENNKSYVAVNGAEETDEDEAQGLSKAERKALRKEEKRRKKEGKVALAQINGGAAGDAVPFNYAAAESVLNAKPAPVEQKVGGKKAFDPYAKALDAPKGKRKAKKEIAGKSFTFSS